MTIKEALSRARAILIASEIEEASLESELLLRHALGASRVQLYLELDRELSPEDEEIYWHLITRRLDHEPVAYITGCREFYGLDFYVNPAVLIPRPETELLVAEAIKLAQDCPLSTIADIGTGCGAIAISLALHLPQAKIYAIDLSPAALEVARSNCERHGVANRVSLLAGDMLSPLPEPVDLIAANLPYVRKAALPGVNTGHFEPALALNGGPDGLDKIRCLCAQAGGKLNPGGFLLLEIGEGQRKAVTALLSGLFPSASIGATPDLAGIDRVVSLTL